MPTLNIDGRSVKVDDSFLKLSPDEQNSTVDEIAKSFKTPAATVASRFPAESEALKPPPMSLGDTAADVGKSLGIGAAKGVIGLGGMAGDLADLGGAGVDWAAKKLMTADQLEAYNANQGPKIPLPTSHGIQSMVEGLTGKFYEPKSTAGEYAQTLGEFAPAAVGGGGSLIVRGARTVVPALASETAGQATKGTAAEPWARAAAAILSPAAVAGARRVITPLPISPERQALVDALHGEGVGTTAGQATGSKPLQWAESTLGDMPGAGGRSAEIQARQGEQFTGAALRRVGENADRATPDVIDGAFRRIGGQFDNLAAHNTLAADQQLGQDLAAVHGEYNSLVGPHQRAPVVENAIRDVADMVAANGGHLTGEQFNAQSSRIARLARGATADPQLHEALTGIRESLHDAMERSMQASGNTHDLAAWREARNQYRNLMVIEKAATGAGASTAEGLISPSQLRGATVAQNRRAYARGDGDFADLARSGEAILKPLPNSGTGPRSWIGHGISALGAGLGGTAGSAVGPAGSAGGAIAGLAAPGIAGRALMSGPVQGYLGNQLLGRGAPTARRDLLVNALLAQQSAREPLRLTVHPDRSRSE